MRRAKFVGGVMGTKKCKECKKQVEYSEYDLCKECYSKWKEQEFKCKNCGTAIDGHNYYWHAKLCDVCFENPNNLHI